MDKPGALSRRWFALSDMKSNRVERCVASIGNEPCPHGADQGVDWAEAFANAATQKLAWGILVGPYGAPEQRF